ncbi:hypothetical protein F7734_23730 [Scytonema sp. UIC 10036]|uniref:hypothetical protein n=1 Tax=Scytonema sp. UIC 10036 TaxID=2304196 RepID=UPI0012DA4802|nr:hypothetical protein [Scytonema sp. UIC 10036]MUG95204.1 hypothetical protein [Scytonema sp. UIC 10036]
MVLCLISGDFNYLLAGVVSLVVLAVFLLVAVNKNLIAAFVFLATAATIAIAAVHKIRNAQILLHSDENGERLTVEAIA